MAVLTGPAGAKRHILLMWTHAADPKLRGSWREAYLRILPKMNFTL